MKNLYLHIGLPKTGTTNIQEWLSGNRAALASARVWVPANPIYAHRLATEWITDARRLEKSDVVSIRQIPFTVARNDLATAVKNPNFVSGIISSEYFFECPPREVERLRAVTGDDQIIIVLFLRRQDRLIESGYNQGVKAMAVAGTLGPPRYQEKLNWLKLFESWAQVFGEKNIRIVNYDIVAKSEQLLPAFFAAVELPEELRRATRSVIDAGRNQSLPANLLEFKRLANALGEFGLEGWLYRAVEAGIRGPSFRLPPQIARQHLAFYAESNRELAHRLGMPDASELFPVSDLGDGPAGADLTNHLPIETLAQLLALHIRETEGRQAALYNRLAALERKIERLTSSAHAAAG